LKLAIEKNAAYFRVVKAVRKWGEIAIGTSVCKATGQLGQRHVSVFTS